MKGLGSGGNFFIRNWIPIVIIAVVVLVGVGAAAYIVATKNNTSKKVTTGDKNVESEEETGLELVDKIVFERGDKIWIMNDDGTGEKQLTFEGYDSDPSLSPDGKYVVFTRSNKDPEAQSTSATPPGTWQLYQIGTDGRNAKKLSPSSWATSQGWTPMFTVQQGTKWKRRNCSQPSFSRDGTSICFVVNDAAYQETADGAMGSYGLFGIAVMNLEGTSSTGTDIVYSGEDLYGGETFGRPEYSKNNKQIFFTYGTGGGPPGISIERMDANGKNRRAVIPCEVGQGQGPDKGYYAFDISPDGKSMVCVEMTIDQGMFKTNLFLVDIDGTRRRNIPTEGLNVGTDRVSFSPDGFWVAFVNGDDMSSAEGANVMHNTYTININGTGMEQITQDADVPDWGQSII